MKTRKLTVAALLTAAALITFIIEAQIPPLTPIYGIKLGLANIFTLFALYMLGTKEALIILIIRVTLGNMLTGQMMSFIYSICGGLLAFIVILILKKFIPRNQLWVTSAIGAVFHNIGQIAVAIVVTGTLQIAYYLPLIVISGIITGIFTGVLSQIAISKLEDHAV